MALIWREFEVEAPAADVWDAIRDVGAVHRRLARGFVADTQLEDGARIVTFANGIVARELIVDVNDQRRRLSYASVGGRAAHHNASFQVAPAGPAKCTVLWITDVLPHELAASIGQMVDSGIAAIQKTLASPRHTAT